MLHVECTIFAVLVALAAPARAQSIAAELGDPSPVITSADAAAADEERIEVLRGEIGELRARGGPVLWHAGLMIAAGAGVAAASWVIYVFALVGNAFANIWCSASCSGPLPDDWLYGTAAVSILGGTFAVAGIVWILERAAPYQADAPRRDRIHALQLEVRERRERSRISLLPALHIVGGGAVLSLAGNF